MVLETSKMDLKRQRLKYMLSNAILELWKKETGSVSSVIIEGTICITSGNGKTTVLQVADKFYGALPGTDSMNNNYGSANGYPANCNGSVPWGVVSPTGTVEEYHESESDSSGTINFSKQDNPKVVNDETLESPQSAKKAKVSGDANLDTSDSSITHNSSPVSEKEQQNPKYIERDENFNTPVGYGVGGYCPGTGYYTCSKDLNDSDKNKEVLENSRNASDEIPVILKKEQADSEMNDDGKEVVENEVESEGELTIDTGANVRDDRSQDDQEEDECEREAMDLSRKDGDLSVMSPQNYTAQVRSVIRQRLLNAGKTSPEGDTGKRGDERETPQPLKSLGLHRSPNSESDGETSPNENKKPWPLIAMNNVVQQVGQTMHPRHPFLNGMPPFPMLSPIPISAMAQVYNTPPSHMHNMLKRKAPPMPPALIPFGHPLMQMGFVPPPTSPLLTPPLPLRSPTGHSSKETSPVSPTGSKDSDKDSTSPDQRIYQCDFCSKTFLFKSKYHEHLPVHTNARPFQCHLCSRTYKYKYDLRVHLRTHMGIPTKSTVCPFCATKFDTNKQLRMHIKDSHREQQKVSEEECTDPKDNLPPAL